MLCKYGSYFDRHRSMVHLHFSEWWYSADSCAIMKVRLRYVVEKGAHCCKWFILSSRNNSRRTNGRPFHTVQYIKFPRYVIKTWIATFALHCCFGNKLAPSCKQNIPIKSQMTRIFPVVSLWPPFQNKKTTSYMSPSPGWHNIWAAHGL